MYYQLQYFDGHYLYFEYVDTLKLEIQTLTNVATYKLIQKNSNSLAGLLIKL